MIQTQALHTMGPAKKDLLKGSEAVDNKDTLNSSIKLKSWVGRVGHMKDNYNLEKHVPENKHTSCNSHLP